LIFHSRFESPLGWLLLVGDGERLTGLRFPRPDGEPAAAPEGQERADPFREVARQLAAYFAGDLRHFDLPLAPEGTPFQQQVWEALQRIPYGDTISYGELACRIGKPEASRAVGAANGRNPIPVVIPCHRVVGADGSLTGFGGGIEAKRALLELERARLQPRLL
jgi:methylated-DNA-[protein]-cysteine S-methyltransferase